MNLRPIFDPERKPMHVACFMSGTGTNVRRIIEHQEKFEEEGNESPYLVVLIFTDDPDSNAQIIAKEHGIPFLLNDIKKFYGDKDIKDMRVREDYDRKTLEMIKPHDVDLIALGGYAWVITKPLLERYPIVNVHPCDLSVTEKGKRKYVGLHHVPAMKAILAGEKTLHSSTHIVTEDLDMGPILVISEPLKVELPYGISVEDLKKEENKKLLDRLSKEHQNRLKEVGDWKIFPLTLQWIAEGRFGMDRKNNLYFDGRLIESGYRI